MRNPTPSAMKAQPLAQDEFVLLEQEERQLRERLDQVEKNRREIATEKDDATRTLPPSELVQSIGKRKAHEELVTRQQDRNIRHEQGRGIFLVLTLVAATIALIWWGVMLMRGT